MTLFAYGERLAPVRLGRYADAATALAWLLGAAATVVTPAGLALAGVLLGLVATSVSRAVASAASFGIVVAAAVTLGAFLGLLPSTIAVVPSTLGVTPELLVVLAVFVPPVVAAPVRALG
ncbi:hypothetical protein JCM30237_02590 [Halolamina litorea]|jgi:hypothetical protein|uniref:Uncharacterized protein n=1 Tax=Halolamina litorea TaxID=1515593 RepID=A0ABD6BS57_9EURY|nr:hypothetical protein [Halolamina litorea]